MIYQQSIIAKLSTKISDSFCKGILDLKPYILDLENINIKDFLAYNFMHYSDTYISHHLMYATKNYWGKLELKDWVDIIYKIHEHELALYTCLGFLYRNIGVDSIKLYSQLSDLNEVIRSNVLKYFEERPGVLSIIEKYYFKELKKYNLDRNSFDMIRERLITSGAILAEKKSAKLLNVSDDDDFTIHSVTE